MSLAVSVFVDQFPELSETFISGELQELRRQGHAVRVETLTRARQPDPEAAAGLPVACADEDSRARRLGAVTLLAVRHPLRCVADLRSQRRWRAAEPVRPLRQLAPMVWRVVRARSVHVHAHFAAGAALDAMRTARLLGRPYSVMTHGYDIFKRPANLAEKHERAAFSVTACTYSVEYLRRQLSPEAGARLHRLVVGVDGARFTRTRAHPAGRTVACVARLVEKKGVVHLLRAAALLRDSGRGLDRVVVVGDGPLRAELEAETARLRLEAVVTFTGPRAPGEVRALLEEADLLVAPCVVAKDGDRDTMPVVVKEALAMEVPVVASDEVGLPEVVRTGWGRLVAPADDGALAEAIAELLAMEPECRRAMGRAGRAFVLAECSQEGETARLAALIAAASRG